MKSASDEKTAYWQQPINHWQASDLSAAHYCQQHQVTYHCFIYWRSQFSREPEQTVDPAPPARKGLSAFVVAQPHESATAKAITVADSLQLALPNGLVVQNIRDGNLSTVRALLERL